MNKYRVVTYGGDRKFVGRIMSASSFIDVCTQAYALYGEDLIEVEAVLETVDNFDTIDIISKHQ